MSEPSFTDDDLEHEICVAELRERVADLTDMIASGMIAQPDLREAVAANLYEAEQQLEYFQAKLRPKAKTEILRDAQEFIRKHTNILSGAQAMSERLTDERLKLVASQCAQYRRDIESLANFELQGQRQVISNTFAAGIVDAAESMAMELQERRAADAATTAILAACYSFINDMDYSGDEINGPSEERCNRLLIA